VLDSAKFADNKIFETGDMIYKKIGSIKTGKAGKASKAG